MKDYKPLSDEEVAPLVRDLTEVSDSPPSYYWPHVLEQVTRANRLARAAVSLDRIMNDGPPKTDVEWVKHKAIAGEFTEALEFYEGGYEDHSPLVVNPFQDKKRGFWKPKDE